MGAVKTEKYFKNPRFTERKIEASEFLIPMADIAPPTPEPTILVNQVTSMVIGSVHFNAPEKSPVPTEYKFGWPQS